ncbi:MAG: BtrH N-terminal domain-containing protein [Bacteroidales bacterium]|jgi:hypothetical protein|nr:BtrH N-terminal domain-containing protein [Bacteroidales bacterium]
MGEKAIENKKIIIDNYPHQRGIHCETGSIKNMLKFHGYDISETLIFGIGSGYDFMHFPFRFFDGHEIPIFRSLSIQVLKKFSKRMGLDIGVHYFINKKNSMNKLDALLMKNIPVGLVAEVSRLPFFPLRERQFSGHHFVIFGKEGNEYIVGDTDPHFPDDAEQRITYEDLRNARFTKDILSPRGALFYIKSIPDSFDIEKGIILGLKNTCYNMLDIKLPYFGVKGIYFLSERIKKYPIVYGERYAWENIKFQIYISEEGGSGGSGFRYLFQNFLTEAATYLKDKELETFSNAMREIADTWQFFALEANRQSEGRKEKNIVSLSDIIYSVAQKEEKFFHELKAWVMAQKN